MLYLTYIPPDVFDSKKMPYERQIQQDTFMCIVLSIGPCTLKNQGLNENVANEVQTRHLVLQILICKQ